MRSAQFGPFAPRVDSRAFYEAVQMHAVYIPKTGPVNWPGMTDHPLIRPNKITMPKEGWDLIEQWRVQNAFEDGVIAATIADWLGDHEDQMVALGSKRSDVRRLREFFALVYKAGSFSDYEQRSAPPKRVRKKSV